MFVRPIPKTCTFQCMLANWSVTICCRCGWRCRRAPPRHCQGELPPSSQPALVTCSCFHDPTEAHSYSSAAALVRYPSPGTVSSQYAGWQRPVRPPGLRLGLKISGSPSRSPARPPDLRLGLQISGSASRSRAQPPDLRVALQVSDSGPASRAGRLTDGGRQELPRWRTRYKYGAMEPEVMKDGGRDHSPMHERLAEQLEKDKWFRKM